MGGARLPPSGPQLENRATLMPPPKLEAALEFIYFERKNILSNGDFWVIFSKGPILVKKNLLNFVKKIQVCSSDGLAISFKPFEQQTWNFYTKLTSLQKMSTTGISQNYFLFLKNKKKIFGTI